MDEEDQRQTELECITAIFPEIVIDCNDPFSALIELPVHPQKPVSVIFPASPDGGIGILTPPSSATSNEETAETSRRALGITVERHSLTSLPSLQLRITLPQGYPQSNPPRFTLSTSQAWLSQGHLTKLEAKGVQMWEDVGHDLMVYDYIDTLQQSAENAFGYGGEGKILEVPLEHKVTLLDFNIKAAQAAFDKETFKCGICLDPKKGSSCHRMIDCGHVFCVECLQDYYTNAISEGDLITVRCLAPNCAKEREKAIISKSPRRKPKTQLSPSELLRIPLDHTIIKRYVDLKHKADLESDKNTVYCPRQWCQGAARSKHRKPDGFEDVQSDDESDAEVSKDRKPSKADRLSICEDCGLAFCNRCYQVWHGELAVCTPKRNTTELTEEEKASVEYMRLHTSSCPTCAAPAQKTHGCNHMICFRCNTHFCYLCCAWLAAENPYKHYNVETTGCFQRLWELEGGDGDDVGIGYVGGQALAPPLLVPVIEVGPGNDIHEEANNGARNAEQQNPFAMIPPPLPMPPVERPHLPELEREGPLVLRINQAPQAPPLRLAGPAVQGARAPVPPPHAAQNVRRPANRRREQERIVREVPLDRQAVAAAAQEAAHQAWVQRFVQMALNDEEDQLEWDSDDEEDDAAWVIPAR